MKCKKDQLVMFGLFGHGWKADGNHVGNDLVCRIRFLIGQQMMILISQWKMVKGEIRKSLQKRTNTWTYI